MTPDFVLVIPARYGASRLPGKPLRLIGDRPLIQHVYARARQSAAREVVVATDDERIAAACRGFGADVALTRADHQSGTDRIAEVADARGWPDEAILVNLQGDEPGMPPALIDQVAADLVASAGGMATLAYPITEAAMLRDPHLVKVVLDAAGFALYFSRAPIPFPRDAFLAEQEVLPDACPYLRHIGLYAYRVGLLRRFVAWPPAPLERVEALEQLRVLYNGERIHVGLAAQPPGVGVDTPEDLERAVRALSQERYPSAGDSSSMP